MSKKPKFKNNYPNLNHRIKKAIFAQNWTLKNQKKGIILRSWEIQSNSNGKHIEQKTQCSWGFVDPITKMIYVGNNNNDTCWKLNSDHRYGAHKWGGSTPYGTHFFGGVSGKPKEPVQEMDTIYEIIKMLNNPLLT